MNRTCALFIGSILAVAIIASTITAFLINRDTEPQVTPQPTEPTSESSPSPTTTTEATPTPLESPTATPRAARGQPDPLDEAAQTEAKEVAIAIAETANNVDTRIDRTRADAHHRAAYLCTPELAAELTEETEAAEDWEWLTWSSKDLFAVPKASRVDDPQLPESNKVNAFFAYRIDLTLHGAKGDKPPDATPYIQYISLTRESDRDPWRATKLTTSYDLEWGEGHEH